MKGIRLSVVPTNATLIIMMGCKLLGFNWIITLYNIYYTTDESTHKNPTLFLWLTSAFLFTSSLAIASWPLMQASVNAVSQ